jgi:hypothetical protein
MGRNDHGGSSRTKRERSQLGARGLGALPAAAEPLTSRDRKDTYLPFGRAAMLGTLTPAQLGAPVASLSSITCGT